jgi:hypothetical protein
LIHKLLTNELGFEMKNERVKDILNEFEDTDLGEFDEELDYQFDEMPLWLKNLKSFQFNWGTAVNSKGGETLCKVISMCAALGLCNLTDMDVSYGPMKIFSFKAYEKQLTAADFTTAVLDTIVFFSEGGYRVFKTGRIESFFATDESLKSAESRYFEIVECAPLVKAGNLQRVKKMDENDYSLLLTKAIDEHTDLYMRIKDTWVKKSLQDRLVTLKRYKADFESFCADGAQRMAPYALYVYGEPGVGKSTVYDVLIRLILNANGFESGDDRIVTIKEGDDYDSTMRSHTNGAIFDDLGNTQAQYTTKSPTDRIIEFKNNVAAYANMADADMKGKVRIAVKAMAATSNVTARAVARTYSNAPFSFVRRFDAHLNVIVKEEFALADGRLDSKKVSQAFGAALIPDCFEIDIGVPDADNKEENVTYKTRKSTFKEVVRYVIDDSKDYFAAQRAYIERQKGMAEKLVICPLCTSPEELCECCPRAKEQAIAAVEAAAKAEAEVAKKEADEAAIEAEKAKLDKQSSEECTALVVYKPCVLDQQAGDVPDNEVEPLIAELIRLDAETRGILSKIPTWVFDNKYMTQLLLFCNRHQIKYMVLEDLNSMVVVICLLAYLFLWVTWLPSMFFPTALFCVWVFYRKYHLLRQEIGRRIERARGLSTLVRSTLVSQDVKELMYRSVALYAFYRLIKMGIAHMMLKKKEAKLTDEKQRITTKCVNEKPEIIFIPEHYRALYSASSTEELIQASEEMRKQELDVHGNIKPDVFADVKLRDSNENPWASVSVSEMPRSSKSETMSTSQLTAVVSKNLYFMTVHRENSVAVCDALFVQGAYVLIPNHMWKNDEDLAVDFRGKNKHAVGSTKKVILSRATSYRLPGTDLCVCYAPGSGSHKDLLPYLFNDKLQNSSLTETPAHMIYRTEDGELRLYRSLLYPDVVNTKVGTYPGYHYKLGDNTFDGMCMGTWITSSTQPCIVGFHLAGKADTPRGAAGTTSRAAIESAIMHLDEKPGVVSVKGYGTLLTEQYGKEFFLEPSVHPRSPISYLTAETNVDFYGQCIGRVSHTKSRVIPTIISDAVAKECGVVQQWGKPKFHTWKPWQQSLSYSANPSRGFEGALVQKAVVDYVGPLQIAMTAELAADIRPLTDMQTVCGIDGKRFIDKMPPDTSCGYPLGGKKRDILVRLDQEEFPEFMCPAKLDPIAWDEAARIEACYKNEERAYPVFKGCLKDEPTPLIKDKVRVFQAAPIGFQLLIRKYYLPVARFLSMRPLESECAVGINAQGPEWDQLACHLRTHGSDRILAGDYSKYDLRMPAQLVLAGFDVLMSLAKHSGNYNDDDMSIMRGIATDIAYPLMAYNGDLIQHYGSNPSGQNLTVYINSIVNSLLMRCAYFSINRDLPPFRKMVALITYGDDVKGSVSPELPQFNHIFVADFLAKHDMKFTMPDKESEATEYMIDEEADLLKRKNVYNKELGMFMGALSEDSIFKSLHAVLRSKDVLPEQQAACNIDGALREWFFHGEEVYEKRRAQMKRVAESTDIAWMCKELDVTYAERMDMHKQRYKLDELDTQAEERPLKPDAKEFQPYVRDFSAWSYRRLTQTREAMVRLSNKYPDDWRHKAKLIALEAEIAKRTVSPTVTELTEEDQLKKAEITFAKNSFSCLGKNIALLSAVPMGEMDALYLRCIDGMNVYAILEAKISRSGRHRAHKQLIKYGKVMALLQPNAHIRTYKMIGHELTFVSSFGTEFDYDFGEDLS